MLISQISMTPRPSCRCPAMAARPGSSNGRPPASTRWRWRLPAPASACHPDRTQGLGETVDLDAAYKKGRCCRRSITPIRRTCISRHGLTHLGSAATRDSMHKKLSTDGEEQLTDSMKMFAWGWRVASRPGQVGVQPEWFYKGNGTWPWRQVRHSCHRLRQGRRREPEVAGIYVIGDDGARSASASRCRTSFPTT